MKSLGKLWAGSAYGTNMGNLFISFDETEPNVIGTLRFLDHLSGIAVYSVNGSYDEELTLTGNWESGGEPENHGVLTIKGRLTPDGNLRGIWSSSIGTGGTFNLYPHDAAQSSSPDSSVPEQLYSRNVPIGSVRMYTEDVLELIQYVQEEFNSPRPVVTYLLRGNEVTKYADDFQREIVTLGRLDYLKVTIQEPEAHGINRLVIIELKAFGINEVRVQGVRESWVIGRAEALATFLRKYESNLVTSYRKFGLSINSVILLMVIGLAPEIPSTTSRLIFVGSAGALLVFLLYLHSKFIPNASIFLTEAKPTMFSRAWPTILSWLITASAGLAAMLVYHMVAR